MSLDDEFRGEPAANSGELPEGAKGVWRVFIDLTVPDVDVADRWGDMSIELLPNVLAIRGTGISEGEDDVRVDLTLDVLACTEEEARSALWAVVEHQLRDLPAARAALVVERETVDFERAAGADDVPIAATPPSTRETRVARVTEQFKTPLTSLPGRDEPRLPLGPPLPIGLFSAHWEGREPHRDFGQGPESVSMQDALDWALAHASRVVLHIGNDGFSTLGDDPAPDLPDGFELAAPDRSSMWPPGTLRDAW